MGRARRQHRLEPGEHLALEATVHGIARTVEHIYGLIVERFGTSDKKAQRLRALARKLTEVMALLARQAATDITVGTEQRERAGPSKP